MKTIDGIVGFEGRLIGPDDAEYETARRVWNGAIDKRPRLIARCTGEDDAARALAFARERGLPVSVRGGGHNVAGSAIAEDGVVIDFSDLHGVLVDRERRIAVVQPGARWGDVDRATQAFGLATPSGIVSDTGVAGLTLGGGFGWLSRRWGLTSDNLVEARMILADGSRIRIAADEHPDLYWAAGGGAGNFGIVTEFTFRLHPLGTEVVAGPLLYPADQASDVLHAYREFVASAPDQVAAYVNLRTAPAFDWVPAELQGTDVVIVVLSASGDLDAGEATLEPFRRAIVPAADLVRRKPYLAHQTMFDAAVPAGWGYYWKSHYLPPLTDGAIDAMVANAWRKSSPTGFSILFHLGGVIAERPADASAASGRDALHALNVNASWAEGGPSHPDVAWAREYAAAVAPHATGGVYVNFLHDDEGEVRIRAAYGARYERLVEIKSRTDPDNTFRSNQNIPPAAAGPG